MQKYQEYQTQSSGYSMYHTYTVDTEQNWPDQLKMLPSSLVMLSLSITISISKYIHKYIIYYPNTITWADGLQNKPYLWDLMSKGTSGLMTC